MDLRNALPSPGIFAACCVSLFWLSEQLFLHLQYIFPSPTKVKVTPYMFQRLVCGSSRGKHSERLALIIYKPLVISSCSTRSRGDSTTRHSSYYLHSSIVLCSSVSLVCSLAFTIKLSLRCAAAALCFTAPRMLALDKFATLSSFALRHVNEANIGTRENVSLTTSSAPR